VNRCKRFAVLMSALRPERTFETLPEWGAGPRLRDPHRRLQLHFGRVAQVGESRAEAGRNKRSQNRILADDLSERAHLQEHRGHCIKIAARHRCVMRLDQNLAESTIERVRRM
jgi:hypothetical protein